MYNKGQCIVNRSYKMANKGDLIEGALNKAWGAWGDIEGGKDDPQK